VGTLQVALAALGVELTTMTAGLYAVVVAVGAIVAALGTYILATGEATAAADRLTAAQAKQKAMNDEAFAAEMGAIQSVMAASKERAMAELSSGAELTRARRAEIDQILRMDAAQAALAVRSGDLVNVNGELRTTASLVEEAFDTADTDKLAGAMRGLRGEEEDLAERAAALEEAIASVRAGMDAGAMSADTAGAAIRTMVDEEGIANLEDGEERLVALRSRLGDVQTAQQRVKADAALAQRAMVDAAEQSSGAVRNLSRDVSEFSATARQDAKEAAEDVANQRQQLAERTAGIARQLTEALEDARADDEGRRRLEQERELADVTAAFAEEAALYRGQAAKLAEIEAAKNDALGLLRARFAIEDEAAAREAADDQARLAKEAADKAGQAARDAAEQQARAIAEAIAAPSGLRKIWKGFVDSLPDSAQIALGKTLKAFQQWRDGVGTVFGAVMGTAKKAIGLFSSMTGFSFNLFALAKDIAGGDGTGSSADQARSKVRAAVGEAVDVVSVLAEAAGPAIDELGKRLPDLLGAVSDAIPGIIDSVVASLPKVFDSIIASIPRLTNALIQGFPKIIDLLVDAIPKFIRATTERFGDIVVTLVRGIVKLIPVIVIALVEALIYDIIPQIPRIVWEIVKGVVAGVIKIVVNLIRIIWEKLTNIFRKKDNKKDGTSNDTDRDARRSAFTGIEWVPAAMRTILHPGEAVLNASQNAQRLKGERYPAPAGAAQVHGASGGGGGAPLSVRVVADGRTLDEVQVRASRRGQATGMTRMIRRTSGVNVGFTPGQYAAFTR
jgi:phage-related protein